MSKSSGTTTSISTTVTTTIITNPASIAIYNRGPVIAIFTPPSSCLATLTFISELSTLYVGHWASGYIDPACYPASINDRGTKGWDLYYYSPAQCPTGWATATSLVSSIGLADTFITIGTDTTAVVCCPSNFRYSSAGHQCYSNVKDPTSTIVYINPTLNGANQWTDTSLASPFTLVASKGSTYSVRADGIPIFYQQSDQAAFALATASSSTPTPSRTSSQTSSQTSSSTAIPSPTPSGSISEGLSSGAKIGLGVGVPLGVILLGLIGAFFWFRRRGKQRTSSTEMEATSTVANYP